MTQSVLFVNRYFYPDHSATSQLLTDLAVHLVEQGWRVRVLTSTQRYDDASAALPKRETHQGVEIVRLRTSTLGRRRLLGRALDYLSFYLLAAWSLLRLVGKHELVVFKTDPPMMSAFLWPFVKVKRARYLNWLQDLFPEVAVALGVKGISGLKAKMIAGLRNIGLRRAVMNVCIGDYMADAVAGHNVHSDRITVIANWTDTEAVKSLPAAENPMRQTWQLGSAFVVGYSGNMGRAHDFDAILAAAAALKRDQAIRFVFVGDGAARRDIAAYRESEGLSNVSLYPYQPREVLSQSLSVPDVHLVCLKPELESTIVPSKFYGVLAAGRPCIFIGDTNGELAELIGRHRLGVAIGPSDHQGLVSAIQRLAATPDDVAAMGGRARRLAEKEYDRAVLIQRWCDLLNRLRSEQH